MKAIYNELAREIKGASSSQFRHIETTLGCELGTITSTGLQLDTFKHEVKDYLVAEHLTLSPDYYTSKNQDHSHKVTTPNQLRPLRPGDRVLVALVNGGTIFVVVGRVVNA